MVLGAEGVGLPRAMTYSQVDRSGVEQYSSVGFSGGATRGDSRIEFRARADLR